MPFYKDSSSEYKYISLSNWIQITLVSKTDGIISTPYESVSHSTSYGQLSAITYYAKYKDSVVESESFASYIKSVDFRLRPDSEHFVIWFDGEGVPACWCRTGSSVTIKEKYTYYDSSQREFIDAERDVSVPSSFELSGYGSCNFISDRKISSSGSYLKIYDHMPASASESPLLRIDSSFTGSYIGSELKTVRVYSDDEYTRSGTFEPILIDTYKYTYKYLTGVPKESFKAELPN